MRIGRMVIAAIPIDPRIRPIVETDDRRPLGRRVSVSF